MLRRSARLASRQGASSVIPPLSKNEITQVMALKHEADIALTVPLPAIKRRRICSDPSHICKPSNLPKSCKESFEFNNTDFKCTICSHMMDDPHTGPCGHSYCFNCLKSYDKCPTCSEELNKLVPNKALKDVVEKFQLQTQQARDDSNSVSVVKNILDHLGKIELNQAFLDQLADLIMKKNNRKIADMQSQYSFLSELLKRKVNDIKLLEMQVKIIKEDLASAEVKLDTTDIQETNDLNSQCTSFIQSNFDEIADNYMQFRMPDTITASDNMEIWQNSFSEMTKYTTFNMLASFNVNDIICSIDFDKDEEIFAAGGITKQIKVYTYQSIFDNADVTKYPVQEMSCENKVTSISFNHFLKEKMGFSSQDGAVTLSDVYAGSHLRAWKEHQDKCWAVHWNQHNPKMIASGSDDHTVKIWASNMGYSAGCINAASNVFSVRFHPTASYFLAHGCADNNVYYHDVRTTNNPLHVLKGHRKSVIYCQFPNDQELVSLSIDNEMKLWNLSTGQCVKTYSGHKIFKTFAGLAVNSSHMICGSEDNCLYVYSRHVSKPILSHDFAPDNLSTSKDNHFVSTVCWKTHSSTILTANSQGYIVLLELI